MLVVLLFHIQPQTSRLKALLPDCRIQVSQYTQGILQIFSNLFASFIIYALGGSAP